MNDPFDVLGVEPRFDLDPKTLEKVHLRLARELHPDLQASPEKAAEILARSAEANDAYRLLKNPWKRARAIVVRHDPDALARNGNPDPAFLMEVMEIRERIEQLAEKDEAAARSELEQRLEDFLTQLTQTLAVEDGKTDLPPSVVDRAARLLHDAGYFRQALARLDGHDH